MSGSTAGIAGASTIIHAFYAAAIGEESFTGASAALGSGLGGSILGMSLQSPAGVRWLGGSGLAMDRVDRMMERYYDTATNPMVAAMSRLAPAVATPRRAVISDGDYFGSDLYNDIFRPHRIAHAAVVCAFKAKDCFAPLGIFRADGRAELGPADYRLLSLALPHLERAIRTYRHIGALLDERRHFERALDALPFGVVFVDGRGMAWRANALAEAILRANDGLTNRKARLCAASPADNRALQHALSGVLGGGLEAGGSAGGALRISRPSLRPPYSVLVVPLPVSNGGEIRAGAIVFVTDPDRRPLPSRHILSRLFDLTPAQARLLALLVAGRSLEQSALALGISLQTARTHLKALLGRTGTHRQSDLVRLAVTSPGVLDHGSGEPG